ncbi:MAG: dienelactone hydrolase family protein [Clostridia bacterium]|nr:dienelactone hydrolase family protein [Clostridia bacterium]
MKRNWLDALGLPAVRKTAGDAALTAACDFPDYTLEEYRQPLADGTFQRVMMSVPKNVTFPAPAVAAPFYHPEGMLGFDPKTGEELPFFKGIEMMVHLAKRGYIALCGEAYHLTYLQSDKGRDDFTRWKDAAAALKRDHPDLTGMGKLTSDTMRLVDLLASDPRVDAHRMGIAGHSLGGKMAFYAGCLDERVKVILASDFGFGWEQSNWDDPWYWDGRTKALAENGMDHTALLSVCSPKPFCLLAGEYDDASSGERMHKAKGYQATPEHLLLVHHGKGHRPPADALEAGYDFLDRYLK